MSEIRYPQESTQTRISLGERVFYSPNQVLDLPSLTVEQFNVLYSQYVEKKLAEKVEEKEE